MNFFLRRIELIFLGLLTLGAAGVWGYQIFWVMPVQKCEQSGNWWDPQSRSCAHVIYLPNITHKPIKPGTTASAAP
jgi:hypothetical protein